MTFNSFYGNLFKFSSNDNSIFYLQNFNHKNLPDFFIKIISKSKKQKEKEKKKEINNNNRKLTPSNKVNNYMINYKNIINTNNINNINIINNTNNNKNNYNTSNNCHRINNNFNILNNLKKEDYFKKKKNDAPIKRKFSESSMINIRKNKFRDTDNYDNIDNLNNKEKQKKEKQLNDIIELDNNISSNNFNDIKKTQFNIHSNTNGNISNTNGNLNNIANYNINFNLTAKSKILSKFPKLTKSKRPLKRYEIIMNFSTDLNSV